MDCYSSGDDGTFPLKRGKQKETRHSTESFDMIEESVASSDSDDMKELLSHYPLLSDPDDYQEHDHNAIAEEALIKDAKHCYWGKDWKNCDHVESRPRLFWLANVLPKKEYDTCKQNGTLGYTDRCAGINEQQEYQMKYEIAEVAQLKCNAKLSKQPDPDFIPTYEDCRQ